MNPLPPFIPSVGIGPASGFRGTESVTRQIADAVVSAGGTVTTQVEDANAVVWLAGNRLEELAAHLHRGVRWVQMPSAGIENLLGSGLVADDCLFTAGQDAYAHPVAEMALAHLLAAARGLAEYARRRTWRPEIERMGRPLRPGTRVVIIGAGGIGARLIALLAPFGVDTIAITRSGRSVPLATTSLAAHALPDLWGAADYFVLAVPATAETKGLIGAAALRAMQPHAWIVNVGRGNAIDTGELIAALHAGRIAGAGLDVTDPEPLPDGHPLWDAPGVLITPHVANPFEDHLEGLLKRVGENVRRCVEGQALLGIVEPTRGY